MAANPNTLTDSFPKYWSKRMQVKRGRDVVYKEICSFEERETLKKGTTVYRPYRSGLVVNTLGADGSYKRQALTDTEEHLTINLEKEITPYIRDFDQIQHNYAVANLYADDAMKKLDEYTDGEVLGEYDAATSVVANFEMGGGGTASDGIGFTLSVDNLIPAYGKIRRKLKRLHIAIQSRWAMISPEWEDVLWQYIAGRESMMGDRIGTNPNELGVFGGFRHFITEGTGWSARLEIADVATADDTIVINGVTFTAKATPASAGEFDVEASASAQATTIALAINNTTEYEPSVGSADTYIELTAANRAKLAGIVATAASSYVTLKGEGVGFIVVSETLTHASSIWTTTKQIQHNLFGQGKPIDLVIQKYPKLEIKDRTGYAGKDFLTTMLLGLKTFKEGADAMVDVQVRSDSWT